MQRSLVDQLRQHRARRAISETTLQLIFGKSLLLMHPETTPCIISVYDGRLE